MPRATGLLDHRPDAGITKLFHRLHDGDWCHETVQDCDPIVEANKEAQNHCSPWNADRTMRLEARIPLIFREVWIRRYGVDFLSPDPDMQRRVDRLLNDSEWRWMRTSNAQL